MWRNTMAETTDQEIFGKGKKMADEFDGKVLSQQISDLSQTVSQIGAAVSKLIQTQTQTTGSSTVTSESRTEDVGGGENITSNLIYDTEDIRSNKKRTYDEYQDLSLQRARRSQDAYDTMVTHAQAHYDALATISEQTLANKGAIDNIVNNQAPRHVELAVDRQWNVDEQGYTVEAILRNPVFKDAIATIMIEVLKSNEASE
jgi:hypothetical protein